MITWESLERLSDLSIAVASLIISCVMSINLLVARGIRVPVAMCALKDTERARIIYSFVGFISLSGICHLEGYLPAGPRWPFVILHVMAAFAGWVMVVVSLYYRTKLLVSLYH